jgi:type I restriction enzyme M protein
LKRSDILNESDIVQRLWGLCHVLRDDGITYHEYVIELTFLLFLKMVDERRKRLLSVTIDENGVKLLDECTWDNIVKTQDNNILDVYRRILSRLGQAPTTRVRDIFSDARTSIRSPSALRRIVDEIDGVDWFGEDVDQFGAAYEGLLEKSADEAKAGAGQYFTPRPLINCIVEVVQPKVGERIQDPTAGSAGFLIAADQFIKRRLGARITPPLKQRRFQRKAPFAGLELVPGTCRLGRMNMLLHGINGRLQVGDALGTNGRQLPRADVILSNPPFGTKRSEVPTRSDFPVRTSNKQLNFLQHIMLGLSADGGRAAVVLPDNALFDAGAGVLVRRELMRRCRLHTILRLPVGIFYAPTVKTHVLFFCRDKTRPNGKDVTEKVWVYDLRAQSQRFHKALAA